MLRAAIWFSLAVICFIIEISGEKVDIYTIIRGFVVIGGMDLGIEYFSVWMKQKKMDAVNQHFLEENRKPLFARRPVIWKKILFK